MRVSIVMAVYNGEKYLSAQLESIREQTVLPFELIAVDDCSTDSSPAILSEFAKRVPFSVRIIRTPGNLGSGSKFGYGQVFMAGMESARGDVVFFSDQDDYWFKEKLSRHLEIYQEFPDMGCVINDAILTDEKLEHSGFTQFDLFKLRKLDNAHNVLGSCTSVKRSLMQLFMPVPRFMAHDALLGQCMTSYGLRYELRSPLQYYRRHVHSAMSGMFKGFILNRLSFANTVHKPGAALLFLSDWYVRLSFFLSASKSGYESELMALTETHKFGTGLLSDRDLGILINKERVLSQIADIETKINLLREEIGLSGLSFVNRLKRVLGFIKSNRLPKNKSGILRAIKDLFYPTLRKD